MNVNDPVKVRLTPMGKKLYLDRYKDLPSNVLKGYPPVLPPVDEEGFTTFQLWDLMSIFGSHLYNGAKELPFETVIEIPV